MWLIEREREEDDDLRENAVLSIGKKRESTGRPVSGLEPSLFSQKIQESLLFFCEASSFFLLSETPRARQIRRNSFFNGGRFVASRKVCGSWKNSPSAVAVLFFRKQLCLVSLADFRCNFPENRRIRIDADQEQTHPSSPLRST